jgi:hypothetical protein
MAMRKIFKKYVMPATSKATSDTVQCGQGILIQPVFRYPDGRVLHHTTAIAKVEEADVDEWHGLKLPSKLGVPLMFGLRSPNAVAPRSEMCLDIDNQMVEEMSIDIDPKSSTFG